MNAKNVSIHICDKCNNLIINELRLNVYKRSTTYL